MLKNCNLLFSFDWNSIFSPGLELPRHCWLVWSPGRHLVVHAVIADVGNVVVVRQQLLSRVEHLRVLDHPAYLIVLEFFTLKVFNYAMISPTEIQRTKKVRI